MTIRNSFVIHLSKIRDNLKSKLSDLVFHVIYFVIIFSTILFVSNEILASIINKSNIEEKVRIYEAQIEELKNENRRLQIIKEQIFSQFYLEGEARNMGMIKDGEILYKLNQANNINISPNPTTQISHNIDSIKNYDNENINNEKNNSSYIIKWLELILN
ncbi:MAG: septum formation initiator family protein [Candidatus Dojkabacteria bacterium]|nr:septum formation initiator family protein [Candidatus Dojkabacteria bacterium]